MGPLQTDLTREEGFYGRMLGSGCGGEKSPSKNYLEHKWSKSDLT